MISVSSARTIVLALCGVVAVSAQSQFELYKSEQAKFLGNPGERSGYKFDYSKVVNDRPIIGVLTQPLTNDFKKDPRFAGKSSYIMASYINILESAGARTVPLIYDADLNS
jgi:hypothetical protein